MVTVSYKPISEQPVFTAAKSEHINGSQLEVEMRWSVQLKPWLLETEQKRSMRMFLGSFRRS